MLDLFIINQQLVFHIYYLTFFTNFSYEGLIKLYRIVTTKAVRTSAVFSRPSLRFEPWEDRVGDMGNHSPSETF